MGASLRYIDREYKLVTPSNHIENNTERAINTFKNIFIAEIFSVDKYFHLQFWYIFLHQATISINLLRKSRIISHLSAYTHIFGEVDYNSTPLAPPETRIVINNGPKKSIIGTTWIRCLVNRTRNGTLQMP